MINLYGHSGSDEHEAAELLRDSFIQLWPGIENTPASEELINIVSNAKIPGYKREDIDIIVCGRLKKNRKFKPTRVLRDKNSERLSPGPIVVENFLVAVEVKAHNEDKTVIEGGNVYVRYSSDNKTSDATNQNIEQLHSLKMFCLHNTSHKIHVKRCLMMMGLGRISRKLGGVVASNFTASDFFSSIAQVGVVPWFGNAHVLSSAKTFEIDSILETSLFTTITPSRLDRKRMDLITLKSPESHKLYESLGMTMSTLRGLGGTGKTIMCLQMAYKAFKEKGERSLVLTYNHALASDIMRLRSLLNVPASIEDGGIGVKTVISFMYSWFYRLGILETEDTLDYSNYDENCKAALELIQNNDVTKDEIQKIINEDPHKYFYDNIIVDESQDWPQSEVELLKALYPIENLCLADGVDQQIRGPRPRWNNDLSKDESTTIPLTHCLRMKRNLSLFMNKLAVNAEIPWMVDPNNNAGGGRIIIIYKPYLLCDGLHDQLLKDAVDSGNKEIDFLMCVSSSNIEKIEGARTSRLSSELQHRGFSIWDGVDSEKRKDFARKTDQFRIVHYKSSRGLEGWTVVLNDLDEYWQESYEYKLSHGLTRDEVEGNEELEDIACKYAWHSTFIPLTRAIDTLVISISDLDSMFSKQVISVALENPEYVETVHLTV